MKSRFRSKESGIVRWQQRRVERLLQALRQLQQLLSVDRQPEALALIPIRTVQQPVAREPHRRTWRD